MQKESQQHQAHAAYLNWLKYYSPGLYSRVITQVTGNTSANVAGMVDWFQDIKWDEVVDKSVELGKDYFEYQQQQKVLEQQAALAAAGYLPVQTGTAVTYVQGAPSTTQQQTMELTAQLVRVLPWILGGLLLMNFMR